MAQDGTRDYQDERAVRQTDADTEQESQLETEQGPIVSPTAATSLLNAPMAGAQRRGLVQSIGQNFGNQSVQRMLGTIRRSASAGPEGGDLEGDLAHKIQSERSSGQPLDTGVRRQVEAKLGQDLSQVRVHTDSNAAELSQQLGAQAFTTGRDIFYGAGHTPSDVDLTTHEATHTIQQGMGEDMPASVGAADTHHEQAAAQAASSSGPVGGGVQREMDDEEPHEVQMKRDLNSSIQREAEDDDSLMKMQDPNAVQREMDEDEMV